MNLYNKYIFGTFVYGLFFILGLIEIIYFSIIKNIILIVINILICIVCLDNFFAAQEQINVDIRLRSTLYSSILFKKKIINFWSCKLK